MNLLEIKDEFVSTKLMNIVHDPISYILRRIYDEHSDRNVEDTVCSHYSVFYLVGREDDFFS